jgi:uncharacterized protein (TIGR03435 family)
MDRFTACLLLLASAQPAAQSERATRPKFEVASIKPCSDGELVDGEKGGGADSSFSPERLRLDCGTVMGMIQHAYVLFANGHVNPKSDIPIDGGPAWIRSDRYRVDAKADGPRSQGTLHGPMLQTLLEDRFKLRIHRETREVPAYALTVAKGGPKLHRFKEGSCTPVDLKILEQFPPSPFPELPPGQEYCGGVDPNDGTGWVATETTQKGPNVTVEARAMSIDDFIKHSLSRGLDRPVVNKTGITGLFDFHLEYAPYEIDSPDGRPPAATGAVPSELAGPSIFAALQRQLGLRLDLAKGRGDYLVIDQVERPSAN